METWTVHWGVDVHPQARLQVREKQHWTREEVEAQDSSWVTVRRDDTEHGPGLQLPCEALCCSPVPTLCLQV